jgi:hypothetical protein
MSCVKSTLFKSNNTETIILSLPYFMTVPRQDLDFHLSIFHCLFFCVQICLQLEVIVLLILVELLMNTVKVLVYVGSVFDIFLCTRHLISKCVFNCQFLPAKIWKI